MHLCVNATKRKYGSFVTNNCCFFGFVIICSVRNLLESTVRKLSVLKNFYFTMFSDFQKYSFSIYSAIYLLSSQLILIFAHFDYLDF